MSAEIKFIRTKSSLVDICAQKLLTCLLLGLKDALMRSPCPNEFNNAKSTIDHVYRNWRMGSSLVTKVVDMFVDTGLGTHTEALLCVVPALRSQFPTDTLELKALGVLALNGSRKSGVELEFVSASIESRLNTRSISPFLRLLCDDLQLLHPTQQHISQLLIFSSLYEQRKSIISYRADIKTILKDYNEFLDQLKILNQQAVIHDKAVHSTLDATKPVVSLESNNLYSVLCFLAKATTAEFGAEKSLPSSKEMSNALIVAARQGSVGVLCILMNLGLDPNQAGDGAKSTLDVCLEHGHEVCARVLTSFGASVRMPGDQGLVLLYAAIRRDQTAQVDLFNTALHLTVKWPATLEILISDDNIHPNTEVKNGAGHTPLCKAVCEGQYESTTLLLERGASPELIGRGQRPMDCAIHNKDE
ncbi:calcium/calmodulin-dependent protein kinase type 1B [Colletotrichum paranaense]|uniref:Calcium/calmodulin-dependent protein kinase type 1B n=1 Tax=Colletotrichum paranaense TaxID=1914294 RepID=A0ABQ9SMJ1_9PEZI|nr:calcium/calmodulin-dependent protein kinase type 1B [Colletotrichum paranaense]KAK1540738.1 calcium/calmodulin-dependent protein kinase type 1B [Colletotrichum paranaense]